MKSSVCTVQISLAYQSNVLPNARQLCGKQIDKFICETHAQKIPGSNFK